MTGLYLILFLLSSFVYAQAIGMLNTFFNVHILFKPVKKVFSNILYFADKEIFAERNDDTADNDLNCKGSLVFKNVTLTAFYPSTIEENVVEDMLDINGNQLKTLQAIILIINYYWFFYSSFDFLGLFK